MGQTDKVTATVREAAPGAARGCGNTTITPGNSGSFHPPCKTPTVHTPEQPPGPLNLPKSPDFSPKNPEQPRAGALQQCLGTSRARTKRPLPPPRSLPRPRRQRAPLAAPCPCPQPPARARSPPVPVPPGTREAPSGVAVPPTALQHEVAAALLRDPELQGVLQQHLLGLQPHGDHPSALGPGLGPPPQPQKAALTSPPAGCAAPAASERARPPGRGRRRSPGAGGGDPYFHIQHLGSRDPPQTWDLTPNPQSERAREAVP